MCVRRTHKHTPITPDVLQLSRIFFLRLCGMGRKALACYVVLYFFFSLVQTFGSHFFLFVLRSFSRAPASTSMEWQSSRVFEHRNKYNIISENPSHLRVQHTPYRVGTHIVLQHMCDNFPVFLSLSVSRVLCCSPLTQYTLPLTWIHT